jgi:hypothetical protein
MILAAGQDRGGDGPWWPAPPRCAVASIPPAPTVNVEILSQEIWTGFSAPDLTDADTDWSELGPLGLEQVDIVREPADQPADSFVAFGEDLQPDTWIVTAVPDLRKGFALNYMPVVELSNLAVPRRTAAIRVTPALALEIEQGRAVTGVVRVLHKSGFSRRRQVAIDVDPSLSSPPVKVMVPVMRLHCPKHTGCQTSEEYAVQRQTDVDFTLNLTPISGGAAIPTSLRCSSEWETADGECLQYVLPAEISTEYGTLLVDGKRTSYPSILGTSVIRFVKGTQGQEKIPPAEDGCQQPAAAIQNDRRLMDDPRHISAGKRSESFNAVNTVRGTLNLGLAAPGWPSLSFNYERTVTTSFTRSYTLVPTADYAGSWKSVNHERAAISCSISRLT